MEKILVVEDDHTIALGLGYSLEEAGYRVEICYNTSAAMRALEAEEKPDLLLLDLSLPDGSGYDICARAKLLGDYPVIFLTARDEEVSVVLGLDMG
ncbi:MAG: response regulator, partial [Christensenellaceae bacterium]